MKQPTKFLIGVVVIVLVVGGFLLVTGHVSPVTSQASRRATYYCPMHPAYTSDRPGDCPICNMKLVKKPQASTGTAASAPHKDICIMHNCPMMHDGKPCPMLVVAKEGEAITCPICKHHVTDAATAGASKKILYWTDPMMPGYQSDKPGQSPMGMDLVPVYAEDNATTSNVSVPEGYASILITPQKQQLIGVKTAPVQRRAIIKTIRAAGTIAHDPELYQAQAEYIQALKASEQAKPPAAMDVQQQAQQLVESTRIRLKHLGLSDALIDEMATWQKPEHGLLFAHPGDPVWMYAQVYEYELPLVRVGQAVTVDVTALPGEVFHGTIRAIDAMVDPMTRTTRVRAQLEDPQGHLRPDMYVNASLTVDLGEQLAVPSEAVFDTGAKHIVFVDKGQGLFEPRDVTLGAQADGYDEVKSGLAESESVITSGNFLIDSESRLKAAMEGAGGWHQHGQ